MFWIKNKKIYYRNTCIPQFFYIKVGFKGVYIFTDIFPDEKPQSLGGIVVEYRSLEGEVLGMISTSNA